MRLFLPFSLLVLFVFTSFIPGKKTTGPPPPVSPLASYSPLWNETRYLECNTAAKAGYMTASEKEVIYILNLVRMNPKLFANTVVKKYPDSNGQGYLRNSGYYMSLLDTMLGLKPIRLLYPDSLCFAGAQCHAIHSGAEGYVGHTRSAELCEKKWYYNGECCDYGHKIPLDVIMSLLIDEGVISLGHRVICLSDYKRIGVAIQPHKTYEYNAVMDFHY